MFIIWSPPRGFWFSSFLAFFFWHFVDYLIRILDFYLVVCSIAFPHHPSTLCDICNPSATCFDLPMTPRCWHHLSMLFGSTSLHFLSHRTPLHSLRLFSMFLRSSALILRSPRRFATSSWFLAVSCASCRSQAPSHQPIDPPSTVHRHFR